MEAFYKRMELLLGEEYPLFLDALSKPNVRGVRVNTIKCGVDTFSRASSLPLSKLSYCKEGFALFLDASLGDTPEHHAGMFYAQDPGAMSTLCALDIPKGAFVLDMCAAPGGKASQLAGAIGKDGFIVANEYVPKRAKIIVSNFERLGIGNAMVTSLDTAELTRYFDGAFDVVLADVPCSGEGMFRKNQKAIDGWSEENVISSAKRQKEILANASRLVRPGGYIIYSTCTYSLNENEMVIDDFLSKYENFSLVPVKPNLQAVTRGGVSFEGAKSSDLSLTRRFYPHISEGEGQFIALLKRSEKAVKMQSILYKDASKPLSREESRIISEFFSESLLATPCGKLVKHGENIVLIQHGCPLLPKSVFMYGTLVGEISRGTFRPSHHFFSVYGTSFKIKEELASDKARLTQYLRGEEIKVSSNERGYAAVTYHGVTVGGGKMSGGVLKNHYPKGLRNK